MTWHPLGVTACGQDRVDRSDNLWTHHGDWGSAAPSDIGVLRAPVDWGKSTDNDHPSDLPEYDSIHNPHAPPPHPFLSFLTWEEAEAKEPSP